MTAYAEVDAWTSKGVQVVRISGEVDLTNAAEVREVISRIASVDESVIAVDLTETAYLDSSGIAMLFRLAERLTQSRQELRIVVPPDSPIRAALELTDLPRTIPVQHSLE
ncbi:anti-sigma B factor antagonist [Kribbella rubisoli]|uniref:Anti-sigma factor antagonist n=1 Tax=Kribbella rubisoli TaxID=3075929 RepID=A0A4Q7WKV1_9ACTN|nr:STAS domain-containing protein [Kribbella rubisoli]RZU10175.1 anti-sigma B factor antagonist [Kribbella rubisoli]